MSEPRGTVASVAVVEVHPKWCPNGRRLVAGNVTKGWLPCLCAEGRTGHRTVYCRTWRETLGSSEGSAFACGARVNLMVPVTG